MNKNLDWAKHFWTQWRKPVNKFAGIPSVGPFMGIRFVAVASCHFPIACFIGNCLIASKLSRFSTLAAVLKVGKIT